MNKFIALGIFVFLIEVCQSSYVNCLNKLRELQITSLKMTQQDDAIFSELILSENLSECEGDISYRAQYYNEEDQLFGDEIPLNITFPDNSTSTVLIKITLENLAIQTNNNFAHQTQFENYIQTMAMFQFQILFADSNSTFSFTDIQLAVQESKNIGVESVPMTFKLEDACPKECCEYKACIITNNFDIESEFIESDDPTSAIRTDLHVRNSDTMHLRVHFVTNSQEDSDQSQDTQSDLQPDDDTRYIMLQKANYVYGDGYVSEIRRNIFKIKRYDDAQFQGMVMSFASSLVNEKGWYVFYFEVAAMKDGKYYNINKNGEIIYSQEVQGYEIGVRLLQPDEFDSRYGVSQMVSPQIEASTAGGQTITPTTTEVDDSSSGNNNKVICGVVCFLIIFIVAVVKYIQSLQEVSEEIYEPNMMPKIPSPQSNGKYKNKYRANALYRQKDQANLKYYEDSSVKLDDDYKDSDAPQDDHKDSDAQINHSKDSDAQDSDKPKILYEQPKPRNVYKDNINAHSPVSPAYGKDNDPGQEEIVSEEIIQKEVIGNKNIYREEHSKSSPRKSNTIEQSSGVDILETVQTIQFISSGDEEIPLSSCNQSCQSCQSYPWKPNDQYIKHQLKQEQGVSDTECLQLAQNCQELPICTIQEKPIRILSQKQQVELETHEQCHDEQYHDYQVVPLECEEFQEPITQETQPQYQNNQDTHQYEMIDQKINEINEINDSVPCENSTKYNKG